MNQLEKEKHKVETELRQLQNRQKILLNKQHLEERRERAHRLIEHGAILESAFPAVTGMTGEEVKTFLLALSHLPGVRELAEKAPQTGNAR